MPLNYGGLLPVGPGDTISGWAPGWFEEIVPALRQIVEDDDVAQLRERNEKLSSYLVTLGILRCTYAAHIVRKKGAYASANPPPDKGIKAWEAAFEESLGDVKETYDLIDELYESTSKRISVTQTNLRSRSVEVTSNV